MGNGRRGPTARPPWAAQARPGPSLGTLLAERMVWRRHCPTSPVRACPCVRRPTPLSRGRNAIRRFNKMSSSQRSRRARRRAIPRALAGAVAGSVAIVLASAATALAVAPATQLSGAIFTTDVTGVPVNLNIYAAKEDVYLNGGPGINAPDSAAGLPADTYAFQVTDP